MAVSERVATRHIPAGKVTLAGNEADFVLDCVRTGQLSMGGYVRLFEERFAKYLGVKHAVAVSNGTAALHLALAAWGIGPGDEVIVPALTFVATANAVAYTGATPVIVDVQPYTWCIDPEKVKKAITRRTKAIIPVHLYGVPADMTAIRLIGFEHGLLVLEDAAEALGAVSRGRMVGSIGDAACFSFYGNKTLTTGEGGMVVTDVDNVAERLRLLRGQGQGAKRYWHDVLGFNYRMTEIQGAIGCAQLERLDQFLAQRRRVLKEYHKWLFPLFFQAIFDGDVHGAWATAVLLPDADERDAVIERMAAAGVETRPVFYPLNRLPIYDHHPVTPEAERLAGCGIVLPTYPGLSSDDVLYVCEALEAAIRER